MCVARGCVLRHASCACAFLLSVACAFQQTPTVFLCAIFEWTGSGHVKKCHSRACLPLMRCVCDCECYFLSFAGFSEVLSLRLRFQVCIRLRVSEGVIITAALGECSAYYCLGECLKFAGTGEIVFKVVVLFLLRHATSSTLLQGCIVFAALREQFWNVCRQQQILYRGCDTACPLCIMRRCAKDT